MWVRFVVWGGVILDTHEAEAQVSQIQGQPGQFSKILSHNEKQWWFVLGTLHGFVMKCCFVCWNTWV